MSKKNKKQSKAKQSKPLRKPGEPVFRYVSVCCNAQATKQPCVMPADKGVGGFGSAPEERNSTLGKFRCSQCGKRCKCNRSLAKQEEKQ